MQKGRNLKEPPGFCIPRPAYSTAMRPAEPMLPAPPVREFDLRPLIRNARFKKNEDYTSSDPEQSQ